MSLDADNFLSELAGYTKAAGAANPHLELDIQKILGTLRTQSNASAQDVADLEYVIRNAGKFTWDRLPDLPDKCNYTPTKVDIEYFENLIGTLKDGGEWGLPGSGYIYKIDKKAKTFTLIFEPETDPQDIHAKNKMCLGRLGWRMIDSKLSTRSYSTTYGHWVVGMFDFPIHTQPNPAKPDELYPPGTRGYDAIATMNDKAVVIRLGHRVAAELSKGISASGDFGTAKSSAAGAKIIKPNE